MGKKKVDTSYKGLYATIPIEVLKLISEYYQIPLTVFFMSVNNLKEMIKKHKNRALYLGKELNKLNKIKEILKDDL